MWKSIKNVSSAVADITMIAGKETCHRIAQANGCANEFTGKIAWKAACLRQEYEERLVGRKRKLTPLMLEWKADANQK